MISTELEKKSSPYWKVREVIISLLPGFLDLQCVLQILMLPLACVLG